MQPPAITPTADNAARATHCRPRLPRERTRASASGGMWRLDRRDHAAFLERHRGLLHDGFVAVSPGCTADETPKSRPSTTRWKFRFVSAAKVRNPVARP